MKNIITIKLPCKALISTGVFTSEKVVDFEKHTKQGQVTNYDPETHYVSWNINGVAQPRVHINCINFLL